MIQQYNNNLMHVSEPNGLMAVAVNTLTVASFIGRSHQLRFILTPIYAPIFRSDF